MEHAVIRRNKNNQPVALVRLRKPMLGKFGVGFSYRGQFILVGILDNRPRVNAIPKPYFRTVFGHSLDVQGYYAETIDQMEFDMSVALWNLPVILI